MTQRGARMFRSKPIGWITAGTLFCVAGVALACRLRDCKETTAGANAAACPVSVEPGDKAEPPKPAEPTKSEDKKDKDAPNPLPSLPDTEKKPAVGELVTPTASGTEPKVEVKVKVDSVPTPAPPSPSGSNLPPPPPGVPAVTGPPSEKDIAKASLLPPQSEPTRPVSATED